MKLAGIERRKRNCMGKSRKLFLVLFLFCLINTNSAQAFSLDEATVSRFRRELDQLTAKLNYLAAEIRSRATPEVAVASAGPVASTSTPTVLHFSVAPKPNYDLIALGDKILELINKIRTDNGLGVLTPDAKLAKVALEHSYDQVKDNITLTNSDFVCHYPLIRHEGFSVDGYSLGERYAFNEIDFKMGGENIAMVPGSTDVYYIIPKGGAEPICPEAPKFTHEDGTREARMALFDDVLQKSLTAVAGQKPANIINKRWYTIEDIASTTVNGWMNSPGHRENILRSEYNVSGMGIVMVNDYIIITHNFVYR